MSRTCLLLFLSLSLSSLLPSSCSDVLMLHPTILNPPRGFRKLSSSGSSSLYQMELDDGDNKHRYSTAPYVLDLHGTRHEIGFDYASLVGNQSSYSLNAFASSVFPSAEDRLLLFTFVDYIWDEFLSKNTPRYFLDELDGMKSFHDLHPNDRITPSHIVSQRFYTLANLPADSQNIISALEQEYEHGLPSWLKKDINDLIRILEKLVHSCDAYGVWGSRTKDRLLYTSRNLDYNSNTGLNRFKMIINYHITPSSNDPLPGVPGGGMYSSIGFTVGLGALAGMSQRGITVSEMNLDNSRVTFSGVPFPLRLRMVLEQGEDLHSSMSVWNSTSNTNSFNFLIGSAPDALKGRNGAYALETEMDFTAQFPANSPIEAEATFDCTGDMLKSCSKWTNETGRVRIGFPLPEAVWRTNHGLSPVIMKTQEPLFNNTVFRYNLMHSLFNKLSEADQLIDDQIAVNIVATLGIKGKPPNGGDYFTCDQELDGDNTMSIVYAPGPRSDNATLGHMYVSWESGSGSSWRPAACSNYVPYDLSQWIQ